MVKELLLELDELKKVAREMEEENEKLRSQLTEAYNVHCEAAMTQNEPAHPKEDTVLMRMYNEGFHICNVKFAQVRNGECLFCMGLLRRQEDGEGGK